MKRPYLPALIALAALRLAPWLRQQPLGPDTLSTRLSRILGTIHICPTLAEANKFAAGNWRKAHVNPRLLAFVERFHRWRRG